MKALLPLLLICTAPAFAAPQAAASCDQIGEQLSETLAAAKQRVGRDGDMRVEFEVNANGRAEVVSLNGSRLYRSPVRIAVSSLDCQRGTPQRYVLNIRFTDPMPLLAVAPAPAPAASTTLAQASNTR